MTQVANKLVMDLDGTICTQEGPGRYHLARPVQHVIDKVNSLRADGWHVVIHTARGMWTYQGDVLAIEKNLREMTERWLVEHGVMYDQLIFGKPPATVYVDDKSMRPEEFAKL